MFDIEAYLQDRDIHYDKEGENITQGWTNINCVFPECGDPKNHLGINPQGTGFSCWMCGRTGKIWKLIMLLEPCSEKEAKKIMYKYSDDKFSDNYISQKYTSKKHDCKLIIPKGLTKEFPKIATNYLKNKRNFNTKEIINKYNVYWGGYEGFFKYRLVFPVIINKEIVTFVGRDITGKAHLTYRNWPNRFSSRTVKNSVFNLDSVTSDKIIIVEGIFDAIRIGDNCVAMLGKTYTKEQVNLILSKRPKTIFIMLDSKEKDPDIEKSINKLKSSFIGYVKNIEILELDKGDPGDLSLQEVINLKKDILF